MLCIVTNLSVERSQLLCPIAGVSPLHARAVMYTQEDHTAV